MKRLIAAALTACMFLGSAAAYQVPNTVGSANMSVHTQNVNGDPHDQQVMFDGLGLLDQLPHGTDVFLDVPIRRADAAVLLTRLAGGEEEALRHPKKTPFADAEGYAAPYIGWLYAKGLVRGESAEWFGADRSMTGRHFSLLLSRIICGEDKLADTILTPEEREWYESNRVFPYEAAVALTVRAMLIQNDTGETLPQKRIKEGLWTSEQFTQAAWDVLSPQYETQQDGKISCKLAGVPVSCTERGGLTLDNNTAYADLDHLLAYARNGAQMEIFTLDPKTLSMKKVADVPLAGGMVADNAYFMTLGTRDYLFAPSGALLCFDGETVYQAVPASAMQKAQIKGGTQDDKGAWIDVAAGAYVLRFTPDETEPRRYDAAGDILFADPGMIVTLQQGADQSTLFAVNTVSGEITDRYEVPAGATFQTKRNLLYGQAGLFTVGTHIFGFEDYGMPGRLNRLTDTPVYDLMTARWAAGSESLPFILTGEDKPEALSVLDYDRQVRTLVTGEQVGISDLTFGETWDFYDGMPHLYGRNGKDAGVYAYLVLETISEEENIYRVDQIMAYGFTPDDPAAQVDTKALCAAEQTRLDALISGGVT